MHPAVFVYLWHLWIREPKIWGIEVIASLDLKIQKLGSHQTVRTPLSCSEGDPHAGSFGVWGMFFAMRKAQFDLQA